MTRTKTKPNPTPAPWDLEQPDQPEPEPPALLGRPPVTEQPSGAKGGRPRLQLNPDWIEQLAAQGMRQHRIAEYLQVSRRTIVDRVANDPEVKEALAAGNFKWTEKLLKVGDKLMDRILAKLEAGKDLSNQEVIWLIYQSKQPHGAGWSDQHHVQHDISMNVTIHEGVRAPGETIDAEFTEVPPGPGVE